MTQNQPIIQTRPATPANAGSPISPTNNQRDRHCHIYCMGGSVMGKFVGAGSVRNMTQNQPIIQTRPATPANAGSPISPTNNQRDRHCHIDCMRGSVIRKFLGAQ